MAVAVGNSTFANTRSSRDERTWQPVRILSAAVVLTLAAIAALSGSWLALGIVGVLFVFGTSLLATADEPLSLRQVASIGSIHLVAGLLLAL